MRVSEQESRRTAGLLLAGLLCSAVAGAAVPRSMLSGKWLELRSAHVRLLTDADPEFARRTVERIEVLHEVLRAIAPTLAIDDPAPRTVLLFRDEGSFKVYRPLYGSRREQDVAAYFQPTPDDGFLILKAYDFAEFDPIALHEYSHAGLHGALPDVPPWLSEGLAEYLSTLEVDGRVAHVGRILPRSLDVVRNSDAIPLDTLLRVTRSDPTLHDPEQVPRFYSQSWLLVHMLLSGQVGDIERFDRFVRSVRSGEDFLTAFRREYGQLPEVAKALRAYVGRARYPLHQYTFSQALGGDGSGVPQRVANTEVLVAAGRMLMWQGAAQAAVAREHLEAALRAEPGSARAMAAMGALEERAGKTAEADAWLARAAAADSADPEVAARISQLLWRRWSEQREAAPAKGDAGARTVARLRDVVGRGLRTDPHDLRLLELLARSYVFHPESDLGPGLSAISRAVRDAPDRPDLVAHQIALLALNGEAERARTLREGPFLQLATPFQKDYTQWALTHPSGGRVPEESTVDEADPAGDGPGPAAGLRLVMADSADIREVDAIERFNWAVAQNDAGNMSAAQAVFDSLARSATDDKLRAAARAAASGLHDARVHNEGEAHWGEVYNEGVSLARRQDRAGALARFREAERNTQDPKLRLHAHRAVVQIEDQIAIEQAGAHLKAGRLAEAEALLKPLLTHELTPERRKSIEEALQSIARARGRR